MNFVFRGDRGALASVSAVNAVDGLPRTPQRHNCGWVFEFLQDVFAVYTIDGGGAVDSQHCHVWAGFQLSFVRIRSHRTLFWPQPLIGSRPCRHHQSSQDKATSCGGHVVFLKRGKCARLGNRRAVRSSFLETQTESTTSHHNSSKRCPS